LWLKIQILSLVKGITMIAKANDTAKGKQDLSTEVLKSVFQSIPL